MPKKLGGYDRNGWVVFTGISTIDFDGNTEVLSMNASELSTIGCRHFHNLGESKKKQIRLTEAQFKRMLTECITKIFKEIV